MHNKTITVKPRFIETRLIWTPHYYGQFSLSLGRESPYIFAKFNPLYVDAFYAPSVSFLTGFDHDCIQFGFRMIARIFKVSRFDSSQYHA